MKSRLPNRNNLNLGQTNCASLSRIAGREPYFDRPLRLNNTQLRSILLAARLVGGFFSCLDQTCHCRLQGSGHLIRVCQHNSSVNIHQRAETGRKSSLKKLRETSSTRLDISANRSTAGTVPRSDSESIQHGTGIQSYDRDMMRKSNRTRQTLRSGNNVFGDPEQSTLSGTSCGWHLYPASPLCNRWILLAASGDDYRPRS